MVRSFIRGSAFAAMTMVASLVAVQYTTAQQFRIHVNNSECVGLSAANRDGGLLVVEQCGASASQLFQIFEPAVAQHTVRTSAGLCLDVPQSTLIEGSLIQQTACNNAAAQTFGFPKYTIAGQAINVGRIFIYHSNKCLDTGERPFIKQRTCNGSATQNFYVLEATASPVNVAPAASPGVLTGPVVPSANAALMNDLARQDRSSMPILVNGVIELIEVSTMCPSGCDTTGNGDAMVYKARTSLLATDPAFQAQLKGLETDYCTRQPTPSQPSLPGKNIGLWFAFVDRYNNPTTQALFTAGTCSKAPLTAGAAGTAVAIPVPGAVSAGGAAVPPGTSAVEDQFWDAVKNSVRPQDYQAYLNNYPNGAYAQLARLKISQLGGAQPQGQPTAATVEDQYWDNVRNSVQPSDFQSYLNVYPAGKYAALARLRISQLGGLPAVTANLPFPAGAELDSLISKAQFGRLEELLGKTRFWVITDPGDSDSKRRITNKLTKEFKQLRAASSEQTSDFFVIFRLRDKNGNLVNRNTTYADQQITGNLKAFTAERGLNGAWSIRVVFEVNRYQAWDANGILTNLFSKWPADAAVGEFAEKLDDIKF